MRIIQQTFAKPDTISTLRTSLGAMESMVTDKAMTHHKEQVSIMIRQSGESIESNTIDFNKDRSGETRSMEEFNPVGVVVIGHGILSYSSTPLPPCFYTTDSVTEESLWRRQNNEEEDEHGIHEDNRGGCGVPRDGFQPDLRDLLTL
jgi:hypothetical protein